MGEVVIQPGTGRMREAENQYPLAADQERKRKDAYDTINYYPSSGGVQYERYFRVDSSNVLQEWRNVDGKDQWVNATGIKRYYYVDGRIYSESGTLIGSFGINGDAKQEDLVNRRFLETYGTLMDTRGRLIDYYGKNLEFGSETAIIQLGPPPGLVPVYKKTVNHVMVDAEDYVPGYSMAKFRGVDNDKGYEKLWVTAAEARKYTDTVWTEAEVQELAKKTKPRDGYYYSEDGRIRFKIVKHGPETEIIAERRMHHTTNWRGSNGLEQATVAWVRDDAVVSPQSGILPGGLVDGGTGSQERGSGRGSKQEKKDLPKLPTVVKGGERKEEPSGSDVKVQPLPLTLQPPVVAKKVDRKEPKKEPAKEPEAVVEVARPEPLPMPTPVVVPKGKGDDAVVQGGKEKKVDDKQVVKIVEPVVIPPVDETKIPPTKIDDPLPVQEPVVQEDKTPVVANVREQLNALAILRTFETGVRLTELTDDLGFQLGLPGFGGMPQPQGQPQGQPQPLPQPQPFPQPLPQPQPVPQPQPFPVMPNPVVQQPPQQPLPRVDDEDRKMTGQVLEHRYEMIVVEPIFQWATAMRANKVDKGADASPALLGALGCSDELRKIVPDVKDNQMKAPNAHLTDAHGKIMEQTSKVIGAYQVATLPYRGPGGEAERTRLIKIIEQHMADWTGDPAELARWRRVLPLLKRDLGMPPGGPMGQPIPNPAGQMKRPLMVRGFAAPDLVGPDPVEPG